jgi:cardiolipin synthase
MTTWVTLAVWGAMALAGCGHVPPHRSLPPLTVTDPSFASTLEGYAAAPVAGGNGVEILLNGDQIFPAQIAAIRAARSTITYAQYSFGNGRAAAGIIAALAERCRAGVAVSVLVDGIGSVTMPEAYLRHLRDAACDVAQYRPVRQALQGGVNHRNHRRVLVVDGRVGFTGGAGISWKWEGGGRTEGRWRDTDVRIEGPAVRHMQAAFVEHWLEATGVVLGGPAYFPDPVPHGGTVRVQIVASSPAGSNFSMYTAFLLAIEGARRAVYITNPYFVPDDRITAALVRAIARGVRVVILLPGKTDWNVVRVAGRRGLGVLLQEGVEIYEYSGALLHAKTMVVDRTWATVGSTNLDHRSFALNAELNAVFYDAAVAARFEEIFIADLAGARLLTYEEWRRRPFWQRLLELLAAPIQGQL